MLCLMMLFPAGDSPRASGLDSLKIGGYGSLVYSHFDYGPDQKSGENGSPPDSRAIVDLRRFILELECAFPSEFELEVEIEFEHGGTGGALELEYEEFGEFETEIEKGGEVVFEQLHLTRRFSRAISVRIGHFIVPVGFTNRYHRPMSYLSTSRPESETEMIPLTWHETGIEVFGRYRDVSYRTQLVNGLDGTGFNSKYWIRDGHQQRFELTRATDMAIAGRIDFHGIEDAVLGVSGYYGNTTGNRPKPDMEGVDAYVSIISAHGRYTPGPWRLAGMVMRGHLQNAAEVSRKNSGLSRNLGVTRTPVAEVALAWWLEVGYDLVSLFHPQSTHQMQLFGRYEYLNTMQGIPEGGFADPRFERRVITAGVSYRPIDEIVLKGDFKHRSFGLERYNTENTLSLSSGFIF